MKRKKIKEMTDEELDQAFEREYKETWLKYNRRRKIHAWICVILITPILLLIIWTFIIPMIMVMMGMV